MILMTNDHGIQEIESIRITPGPSKTTTTRTVIRLPSGINYKYAKGSRYYQGQTATNFYKVL